MRAQELNNCMKIKDFFFLGGGEKKKACFCVRTVTESLEIIFQKISSLLKDLEMQDNLIYKSNGFYPLTYNVCKKWKHKWEKYELCLVTCVCSRDMG